MGIAKDITTPQNSTAGYWGVHQMRRRKAYTQVFPCKVLTAAEAYTLTKALEGSPLAGGVDVLET